MRPQMAPPFFISAGFPNFLTEISQKTMFPISLGALCKKEITNQLGAQLTRAKLL